jgi:microcystin-dependent protein
MAIWQWSKTPASNAGADPTINLAEGQAPSTLNDSLRNMAAQLAAWRDDTNGSLVTTGGPLAFLLATNQAAQGTNQGIPATPPSGTRVSARLNVANSAGATLRVDGGTTYPMWTATNAAVTAGLIPAGTVCDFIFNSISNVWMVSGWFTTAAAPPAAGVIPVGGTIIWWTDSLPTNWLWCNGQSTSGFPVLAALVGTTTPDLREVVPMGRGGMGGTGARGLVSFTGSTVVKTPFGEQNHKLSTAELATHRHGGAVSEGSGHSHTIYMQTGASGPAAGGSGVQLTSTATAFGASTTSVTTGATFTDGSGNAGVTTNVGSDDVHNNMQPTYTCNWIIRAA